MEGQESNFMDTLSLEGALCNNEDSSLFVSEETNYYRINTSNKKKNYDTSSD